VSAKPATPPQLKKSLIELALGAVLSDHLGHEEGDPGGRGSGNGRNRTSAKTILTELHNRPEACRRDVQLYRCHLLTACLPSLGGFLIQDDREWEP
jgi:hypothetical protein